MENIFSVQPIGRPQKDETKNQQNESATVVCFKCDACGHKYKHNAIMPFLYLRCNIIASHTQSFCKVLLRKVVQNNVINNG